MEKNRVTTDGPTLRHGVWKVGRCLPLMPLLVPAREEKENGWMQF